MDLKQILDNIDSVDFAKMIDDFNKEVEKWTWKNEGNFLTFLNELIEYVQKNKNIGSEDFLYSDTEIPFTSKNDYNKYMASLFNKILSYCEKYKLPLINDSIEENLYFTDFCLLFKYNENLYKVKRISGQGTIDFISLYEGNNSWFIDYDLIIKDLPPLNYKQIIEDILKQKLLQFKISYSDELNILGCDVVLQKDEK